jgi:hypothetical protein
MATFAEKIVFVWMHGALPMAHPSAWAGSCPGSPPRHHILMLETDFVPAIFVELN